MIRKARWPTCTQNWRIKDRLETGEQWKLVSSWNYKGQQHHPDVDGTT